MLPHFDLVVGTSTGGIIALALAVGLNPPEIVDVYVSEMSTIFPRPRSWRPARQLVRPKRGPARGAAMAVEAGGTRNTVRAVRLPEAIHA
jgi:predicted acylesterase/phospholipase RssA